MLFQPGSPSKYSELASSEDYSVSDSDKRAELQSGEITIQEEEFSASRNRTYFGSKTIYLAVCLCVAGIVLTLAIMVVFSPMPSDTKSVMISPCGSTPEEAMAKGCHFDLISFCWLSPRCYDAELSDEFERYQNWEWFEDKNKTKRLGKSDVLAGAYPSLFVSWEYHIVHCVYAWKKLHRAMLGSGNMAIDSYIGSFNHTKHCGSILLGSQNSGLDEVNSHILTKYPDCGIAGTGERFRHLS